MNWQMIIRDYGVHHRSRGVAQLDWIRSQPSLEAAIGVASSAAVDESGKRHSHQWRISPQLLREAEQLLLKTVREIAACNSFHDLWTLIDQRIKPVAGLGELYIYDTALRVGAYMKLIPEKVYLHRGTRVGAKKANLISGPRKWLEMRELPTPLRGLPASEVEDILCIYKDGFSQAAGCPRPSVRC